MSEPPIPGSPSPSGPFEGRLLDGRSPRPRRCTVAHGPADLELLFEDGVRRILPLASLESVQRVAREAHLVLPPLNPGEPQQRLEVFGPDFLSALDLGLDRVGGRTKVQLQKASRRIGLPGLLIAVAGIVVLSWAIYSVAIPRLHVLVPRSSEVALGETIYKALQASWTLEPDAEFDALAARMVDELRDPTLDLDLRVELVDTEEINAVSLPGGLILVFRGLVAASPSPDALAGVLAHEIVHAERRHSLKSLLKALGVTQFAVNSVGGGIEGFELAETILEASSGLVVLKHSREHEFESDQIAVAKLRRAGREATGLLEFVHLLQEEEPGVLSAIPGWLSTHPATQDRIEAVRRNSRAQPETRPWMSPEDWEMLRARLDR